MKAPCFGRYCAALILGGVATFTTMTLQAAKPDTLPTGSDPNLAGEKVEMFDAIKKGDIDVKLIPHDSRGGNVIITNKTKKPLSIQLPAAFAGLPVLAQRGGAGGAGGMGGRGMMQGMGGGMGGMGGGGMGGMGGMGGGGMGGMGGGGGFFNVGPEKVGKIKVTTVCLEHGKTEPSPRVAYELKPIETFVDKPEVAELCKMVGRGEISQNSAQAAAWHLNNGMTWEELAAKVRIKHLDGSTEMYFDQNEIRIASATAVEAVRRGKENPLPTSSKQDSLSQK